ncbi:MAG: PorP/SprF family type IX secretion system membrane protein [Chitinophagales bacterium]|nr:PorP/SprF family type IX secretion system membrane protein [Chitinophagales bacterium]MDW8394352.1 PorP/SprF family type IX secretion system membrane protein [Chitinophagales bacterium]
MSKPLRFIFMLLTAAGSAAAQDIHFSQFYFSPLTVNPALTGAIDGTFRIGGIYRNQWSSITSPFVYSTPSIAFDAKLFSGGFTANYLGAGILLLNDRSGDGNLTNITGMLSLAYHQSLDREGNYHLAAGLQGGFVQKSIDFEKLNFGDEFDGLGFGGVTNEFFKYYQIAYADFAGGVLLYGIPSNRFRFQLGGSIFHLTTPRESFFESSTNQLDMRFVAHGSAGMRAGRRMYFFPFAQYQFQNNDNEAVVGANIGYNMSESLRGPQQIFYVGVFNRVRYDIIPTVGIMMKGFQAGISYDVNISPDLRPATGGKGGFELAVAYIGNITPPKHYKRIFCPSF